MNYLSFGEFKDLTASDLAESEFNRLLILASMKLDYITQDFYTFHNLENDEIEFRKNKFKMAVALQIKSMAKTGIETASDAENQPIATSQNIGGTSVSKTYANRITDRKDRYDMSISKDAIECLANTGLLYRGIKYVRH